MATKKSAVSKKKPVKRSASKVVVPVMEKKVVEPVVQNNSGANSSQTFNLVVGALVVVVLALGFMRYKYLFVPAVVNGSPIYSWQYVKVLNQTAGKQVMDQLVVEKLIAQEADKQKVTLTNEEVDAEFARLDKQFESAGGLDAFLATQGLAKADIRNQLELNLKVQKIVAGQVNVTDEDVSKYYAENKADYKDLKADEAAVQIKQMLADQALQQQVGTWIQDLRSKAQVTLNLPNAK